MNDFFTSINNELSNVPSQNNSNALTTDKLNKLLEQAASGLTCGPTCQKLKVSEELKQKYLDAQTNLETAPIRLETTKKQYYAFSEGQPYYDNMVEEELKEKADKIAGLIKDQFDKELLNAKTLNNVYNTNLINSKNTEELYKEYLKKNKKLEANMNKSHGDILTNDRKTYYEVEEYEYLHSWYRFYLIIYYIIWIIWILALFLTPNPFSFVGKIVNIILIAIYPFIINRIVLIIWNFIQMLLSFLPKNVYNNL